MLKKIKEFLNKLKFYNKKVKEVLNNEEEFELMDDKEFEELMKEMEKDMAQMDFSIPDDWDRDFRNAMDEALQKSERRKRIKTIEVLACLVLMSLTGFVWYQKEVKGTDLIAVFGNSVRKVLDIEDSYYGSNEDVEINMNDLNQTIVYYHGKTFEDVNIKIEEDIKKPFFRFDNCLEEYDIISAYRDMTTDIITMELETLNGKIFIMQEEVLDIAETSSNHKAKCYNIWNKELEQEIIITENLQNEGVSFSAIEKNTILRFEGDVSLEICIEFARNIYYK